MPDGRVDFHRQLGRRLEEVDEGPAGAGVRPLRIGRVGLALAELLGVVQQLGEVRLVVERPLAPLGEDGVEQFRHLVVVLRVQGALVDDQLAHVVGDGRRHRLGVLLDAGRQLVDGAGAELHDELDQACVLEVRDRLRRFGADVGVEQVAHAGFVLLEVDVLARADLHLGPDVDVVGDLRLDRRRLGFAVAGGGHVVGEVGVGARHGRHRLVQLDALRLVGLELLGVARLGGAEVLLVLAGVLRRFDRLTQRPHPFQRLVEVLAPLVEAVRQQALDVGLVVAVERAAGVVGDGRLQRVEQVAVVDDVAVVLVVAVEPVDAADGLEQAVVLHLLVDVQVGGARRVEAGQQLVDDDEQPHLARVLDEALLDLVLELLDLGHRLVGRLVEVVGQHLAVDLVLAQPLGGAVAGVLLGDVAGLRRVGGDDGALALEAGLAEQLVELAGLVDARADEHGVAATVHEPRPRLHVQQDVVDDLPGPRLGADDLLHGAPALLELGPRQVGHALGPGGEPLVDLGRRRQLLVDGARLVAQVEHHAVLDGLVELVGVDEAAEGLDARRLVGLEQRRAGEADEHGARQQLLHGVVQLAGLRAVGLVDEDEDVALGPEVRAARWPAGP